MFFLWEMAMTTSHQRNNFENSKTRRGSYLLIELFMIVQIFEFYIVTQSLYTYYRRPQHNSHLICMAQDVFLQSIWQLSVTLYEWSWPGMKRTIFSFGYGKQKERERKGSRKREWKGGRMEWKWKKGKETFGRKDVKDERKSKQKKREREEAVER